jgi:uncharacterized membrane protein
MRIGKRVAPARYLLFIVTFGVASVTASRIAGWHGGWLVGFDAGALAFLVSVAPLLRTGSAAEMRRHAAENDANRLLLLFITAAVVIVILAAITLELAPKGNPTASAVILIVATLVLTWMFANMVFALHYAHIFYLEANGADSGGIDFPHTKEPGYWEFIYFSFCLGMTFQTSDTDITATRIRQIVTMHTMMAFLFNIGIIAFTINVLGGGGSAQVAAMH